VGFCSNIYAAMGHSKNALGSYLIFGSCEFIEQKKKEVVDLAVSQLNECRYCQSAHTITGKMNGFTDEQIIELREVEQAGIIKSMFSTNCGRYCS
jgi:AhpD family alkylhydroperoxidase